MNPYDEYREAYFKYFNAKERLDSYYRMKDDALCRSDPEEAAWIRKRFWEVLKEYKLARHEYNEKEIIYGKWRKHNKFESRYPASEHIK